MIFFFPLSSYCEISKSEFSNITNAFAKSYPDLTIHINPKLAGDDYWWNLENKYASYSQYVDPSGKITHNIFFFGGLARMSAMTSEGAALIICHELGHGIAGSPLKNNSTSSVEGQADYFSTRFCLPKVLNFISTLAPVPADPLNICKSEICKRIFIGIQTEISVILTNVPNQTADFEHKAVEITDSINTSPEYYPTAQCRLDTFITGALEVERPRCWWTPF